MIRALVFDFDGLIIDSETAIAATWIELYARYGLPFPEHLWRRMVGTREHDDLLWTDLAERTGLALDVAELEVERRARGVEFANRLHPLPGVVDASRCCRDGGARPRACIELEFLVGRRPPGSPRPGRAVLGGVHQGASGAQQARSGGVSRGARAAGRAGRTTRSRSRTPQAGVAAAKAAGLRVVAVPGSFTRADGLLGGRCGDRVAG